MLAGGTADRVAGRADMEHPRDCRPGSRPHWLWRQGSASARGPASGEVSRHGVCAGGTTAPTMPVRAADTVPRAVDRIGRAPWCTCSSGAPRISVAPCL